MITHEYRTEDYEKIYGESLSLPMDAAIVNMDSGKDMMSNGKWMPRNGEIVSMAILYNGKLSVFVKTEAEDDQFYIRIKDELDSLIKSKVRLYALYKDTEEGMLFSKFGANYIINELRAEFSKELVFWQRQSFLQILKEQGIIKRIDFGEPFLEPMNVITSWGKYITTGETAELTKIQEFTQANVIKEGIIFLQREALRKFFEERAKKKGDGA